MIALIPARRGSERVRRKNMRELRGHPLLAYTLAAARQSGVFDRIDVVTDDYAVAQWMFEHSSARAIWRNPADGAQPDIVWIKEYFAKQPRSDNFAILRPTSPFRTADTIRRCYQQFIDMGECGDSIRAVEPVKQTPYKMWTWEGPGMPIRPLLDGKNHEGVPWHSCPTQTCPTVYVQNSSLEMSWTANVECHHTIHGRKVGPFFTEGLEGFSIDTEADWREAVRLADEDPSRLPPVALGTQEATAAAQ